MVSPLLVRHEADVGSWIFFLLPARSRCRVRRCPSLLLPYMDRAVQQTVAGFFSEAGTTARGQHGGTRRVGNVLSRPALRGAVRPVAGPAPTHRPREMALTAHGPAVTSPTSGSMNKLSRVIAVNLDRERKFAEAFRYFDADDDGFIDLEALAQLLRCFGRGVTTEELELLRLCLVPDRITLRDFLNVLASNFASSFHMPKTLIADAFKLHNAAHSGKKSQTVMGHLEVDDGDLVSRHTWRELSTAFARPITGTTPQERQGMDSYLARVQVGARRPPVPSDAVGPRA